MLWQRVVTAAILIPLVVAGILYLDNRSFAIVLAAVMLIGAAEMARLANLSGPAARTGFVLAVAALVGLAWRFLPHAHLVSLQWLMVAWWTLVTVMLVLRRRALLRVDGGRVTVMLLGGLVLVAAWVSITRLHAVPANGPALVLFLFVLIWVADSGAYFAGRAFGRRKLSPFVSPGKTWAGVAGALAGAVLAAVVLPLTGVVGGVPLPALILLCLFVTAISIGGDLWISRLKREAGVKDSGTLLPGHGGMLDRIDSLLAAAPVFALGAALIGATA